MSYKLIDATEAKPGVVILVDKEACTVRNLDISKTGKHGASKCRIEAIGIIDGKKRVIAVPGHERFEVPLIKKLKGQVMSVGENKANIMDLESFETLDVAIEPELAAEIHDNDTVEYWDVEGKKIVKRKS
jgi:translation initiation factor 5A